MIGAAVSFFLWIIGLFTGKKRQTEEELGAKEAENASLKTGLDAIDKANRASTKVKDDRSSIDNDPNNLDR